MCKIKNSKQIINRRNIKNNRIFFIKSESFRQQALAGEILEVSEIINAYANKLNKKVLKSTVYDLLHRHDWRKVMPRSEHPNKANDEAIELENICMLMVLFHHLMGIWFRLFFLNVIHTV